jgi:hypothetical protein
MYASNFFEMSFAVSQWYLFGEAAINRPGGMGGGTQTNSPGLKASLNCCAGVFPEGCCHWTGRSNDAARNWSFAISFIIEAWGAGTSFLAQNEIMEFWIQY